MNKYLLIFILCFFSFSASGEEKLAGSWEGYFISSEGGGYLRLSFGGSQCYAVITGYGMWTGIKPEKLAFECESLIKNRDEYQLNISKSFPDKSGEIQKKFIFAISTIPEEKWLPRTIEGVWLTKLVGKKTGARLVESVRFTLVEIKDKSIIEHINEILR